MIRLLRDAIFPGALLTGGLIRELLHGSFKILIEIQSLKALEHLWKSYKTGELKSNLEDVFINQDLINSAPEDTTKIELSIVINEDEYHEASRRLMDEKMRLPAEQYLLPCYHPQNPPTSSKRASNTVVTLIDETGKSSPIVYEAKKLSWPVITWLLTKGNAFPVTTGKIEIRIDDPVRAIAAALIGTDGDINVTDMSGKTMLMNAAIEGKEEVVKALLDSGADQSMVDPKGKSAVEYTTDDGTLGDFIAKHGKEMIKSVIKWELIFEYNRHYLSVLANFVEHSGDNIVERLLAAGVDVNLADSKEETSLIWALRNRYDKIANALIKSGADVNRKDKDQKSPLMIAVKNNKENIAERLLDAGAYPTATDSKAVLETALVWAVKRGHDEMVDTLIKEGADKNCKDKFQNTPLIHACKNSKEVIAEYLIDVGVDVNVVNDDGKTALMFAAEMENDKIFHMLTKAGADINVKDKSKISTLMYAVKNIKEKPAEIFINAGADVNVVDEQGRTPLTWATIYGMEKIVLCLINAGADVNVKDKSKMSPLMHAVHTINEKQAEILINAGAEVNVFDVLGETPLILATIYGMEKTVISLIRAGADVNVQSRNQRTPLMLAIPNSRDKIAEILTDSGAEVDAVDKHP
ncbi:serine/threonine-protein phosphatase 6 regulatory ankyrin repeat subunit C [Exaiptasia diaphana]|uniref:Peptidase A2 domain-containing protein n=1 Tax=Exaiptasia diaphana TaxID=2652724 RepID=A0A913Y431_EXADI|nr:serine/threonine-protein phosphatase 6 regulatory ankyrin repeat subunit C [Exaiptasia diaphana]